MLLPVLNHAEDFFKNLCGIVGKLSVPFRSGENFIEKAAVGAGVAGRADLNHLRQNGIIIAVGVQGFHILEVSAGLSLHPELSAASAEIGHFSSAYGGLVGFLVHVGLHQHRIRPAVLDDDRNHAVGIFLQLLPGKGGLNRTFVLTGGRFFFL